VGFVPLRKNGSFVSNLDDLYPDQTSISSLLLFLNDAVIYEPSKINIPGRRFNG
jgi:hypothetical protein